MPLHAVPLSMHDAVVLSTHNGTYACQMHGMLHAPCYRLILYDSNEGIRVVSCGTA